MNFSDNNVKIVTEHANTLISIFHFDDNDQDHYCSLSDDGQLKEWLFNQSNGTTKEIDQCVLIRPSDEILRENKHKIPKLRKNDYLKITKSISFNHFISLGYEDGLVLVYSQEVQKGMRKNQFIDLQEGNNGNGNINDNYSSNGNGGNDEEKRIKEEEEDNEEGGVQPTRNSEDQMTEFTTKKYYNAFSLYYILLGHSQRITCLYYIKPKNNLVTASDNFIVKIYDIETGHSLYHFNLDCVVSQIIFINETKRQQLIFLCQEPYKLVIDIAQEPFSFNHYTFKYNEVNRLYEGNKTVIMPGKNSNLYWFSSLLEYKDEIKEASKDSFEYIMQYQDKYIIFDDKMKMRIAEINLKQGECSMKTLFKIPVGRDSITKSINIGAWGIMACQDGCVYSIEFEQELALYWNRNRMSEEDKVSDLMNKALENKKGKKPKKGEKGLGSKNNKGSKGKKEEKNEEKKDEKLPKIKDSTSKPKTKKKPK